MIISTTSVAMTVLWYLLNQITIVRTVQLRLKIGMQCSWTIWERAAANPSAVNPVQCLWLESCCWSSEDQEMTFGKTLQWRVFLWRTDRRPCQQPLEAVSFPSKNVDNGCPLRCLSITLSKHWVSKPTHSGRVPANDIFPQFQMASIVSSMDTVCNVLSLKWG